MCTANECYLCETGYSFNAGNDKGFKRGIFIPYNALGMFIKEHGRYSVFCSAYRYDREDTGNANLYGDFYLDFDSNGSFDLARDDALTALSYFKICYKLPETCMRIYFSGSKGIHITVPAEVFGIQPTPCLNGVFKYIACSIKTYTANKTVDTQIYDSRRLFRIPNTIHERTHLYKIPLTAGELKNMCEHEIKNMALQPRMLTHAGHWDCLYAHQQFIRATEEYHAFAKDSRKNTRHERKIDFVPPCIQHILDSGAEEGMRNITIACLAGFYRSSGKSLQEAIDTVAEWNSRNTKPTGMQELKKTVSSIFNGSKQFGCTTLKEISACSPGTCRIARKGR